MKWVAVGPHTKYNISTATFKEEESSLQYMNRHTCDGEYNNKKGKEKFATPTYTQMADVQQRCRGIQRGYAGRQMERVYVVSWSKANGKIIINQYRTQGGTNGNWNYCLNLFSRLL